MTTFYHFVDNEDEQHPERQEKFLDEFYMKILSLGGTFSCTHGVGSRLAKYMKYEHDPAALTMMRRIKEIFDPNNVMNPSKMLT